MLSFPAGTEMFHFPAFPPLTGRRPLRAGGVSIRRSPDQRAPAPPRGLSQLATAFVGGRAKASTGRRLRASGVYPESSKFSAIRPAGPSRSSPFELGSSRSESNPMALNINVTTTDRDALSESVDNLPRNDSVSTKQKALEYAD